MPEQPNTKPTSLEDDKANWAFDPLTLADTVGAVPSIPDDSRRLNGFSNTIPDEPSATHFNYLLREALRNGVYLDGIAQRHFDTLAEGCAATSVGDRFIVRNYWPRNLDVLDSDATTGEVTGICSDGEQLYIATNDGRVTAYNPDSFTVIWTVQLDASSTRTAVCTDGAFVYAALNFVAGAECLFKLDRTDGSTLDSRSDVNAATWVSCQSNGEHFFAVAETDSESIVRLTVTSFGGAGASVQSLLGGGEDIRAIAIGDEEHLFVVGEAAGNVRRYNNIDSTLLVDWSSQFGDGLEVAFDVCTDGDLVFVTGESGLQGGTTTGNTVAYSYGTGEVVWVADLTAEAGSSIACDGTYVYVLVDTGAATTYVYALERATGAVVEVTEGLATSIGSGRHNIVADGVRVYAADDSQVRMFGTRRGDTEFERVDTIFTNVNRRFYRRAIPAK